MLSIHLLNKELEIWAWMKLVPGIAVIFYYEQKIISCYNRWKDIDSLLSLVCSFLGYVMLLAITYIMEMDKHSLHKRM